MALNSYSLPVLLFESVINSDVFSSSVNVSNESKLHDGISSTFASFQGGSELVYDLGTPTVFDSIGISRNTMATALATISFHGSNDGVNYTTLCSLSPSTNKTHLIAVSGNYRYIKMLCSSSAAFNIANIYIGNRLEIPTGMQTGFTPPRFNSRDTLNPNTTMAGNLAGITLLHGGYDAEISLKYLNPNWVRTYADKIINGIKSGPFFFVWDFNNYPEECMFCWAKSDVPAFSYSNTFLMESNISVNGIV